MAVVVAGTFTVEPDKREDFLDAARELMAATHAEEGCIEYVFSADPNDAGLIRLFEKWESADNLVPHMKAPHIAEFGAKVPSLGVTGSDITLYEVESEKKL